MGAIELPDGRKITVINGWVLVRADPDSERTASGLLVKPQKAREHLFMRGTVLSVSDGWKPGKSGVKWKPVPCPIPVGARVAFLWFYSDHPCAGFRAWLGDDSIIPLKMEDVLLYDDPELEGRGIDDVRFG